MTHILSGKVFAKNILDACHQKLQELLPFKPKLVVIQVGQNPASSLYIQKKIDMCQQLGIISEKKIFSQESSEKSIIEYIQTLNNDEKVSGILLQLPLPSKFNSQKIIDSIIANKDVDGISQKNAFALSIGKPQIIPCTAFACYFILKEYLKHIEGLHIAIIGRSKLVGKPLAQLLLLKNCSITQLHSYSKNISFWTKNADVIISAVGKKQFIKKSWVNNQSVILDVGINTSSSKKTVGDVDYPNIYKIVKAITPVPGGIGPMTVAFLMHNLIVCSLKQKLNHDLVSFLPYIL